MENFDIQLFNAPLTKAGMQDCAGRLLDRIGETEPLQMYVRLKWMEETLGAALKDRRMQDAIIAEREKYGKMERVTADGAEITTAQKTVRDFSTCQDAVWLELNEQLEAVKAKLKDREKILAGVDKETIMGDTETGAVWTVYPAMRQITEYIKVTFPKA